jgi:hypothetical protein
MTSTCPSCHHTVAFDRTYTSCPCLKLEVSTLVIFMLSFKPGVASNILVEYPLTLGCLLAHAYAMEASRSLPSIVS